MLRANSLFSRHRCTGGTSARARRNRRMWSRKSCGGAEHFGRWRAYANIGHVHNRVPVATELANLLLIDFENEVGAMASTTCRGLQVFNTEPPARDGGKNPHQCALRIAVVNVKCVHVRLPS